MQGMITRREGLVALTAVLFTTAVFCFAQPAAKPLMKSRVFNWADLPAQQTRAGERRPVFDAPTTTLARFQCHVKDGVIEAVLEGKTNRVEAGGIIFCASNELHGLRNIGTNRATYYVLKWVPHDLAKHVQQ
jgi:XRE family transcriptional regulator, regulator of sulfur utilization